MPSRRSLQIASLCETSWELLNTSTPEGHILRQEPVRQEKTRHTGWQRMGTQTSKQEGLGKPGHWGSWDAHLVCPRGVARIPVFLGFQGLPRWVSLYSRRKGQKTPAEATSPQATFTG